MSGKALQKYLDENLKNLKNKGLYNEINVVNGANGPIINIGGKRLINLSSNNYLGLANHPRLIEAAIKATEKYGVGAGAVRTINGSLDIHEELDEKLAEFKHTEAVITFQSGFNCNIGAISAVMTNNDAVLSDVLNHPSILDGCKISGAKFIEYEHSNIRDLRNKAKAARDSGLYSKIMVITDGVFSMDGDIARLPDIVEIADEFELITYVDDAHASGVLGQNGSGSATHHDLVGKLDFQIGTLSKAIGVVGGYVAGSKDLIDWLRVRGRPFLFSTSMTPGAAAACIEAIDILSDNTAIVDKLWHNGRYLKRELKKLGFNIGHSETPITPCIIGDAQKAQEFSKELFEEGVYAKAIVYPTVPMGFARVRNMPTAAHTEEMLDEAINAYERVGRKLGII